MKENEVINANGVKLPYIRDVDLVVRVGDGRLDLYRSPWELEVLICSVRPSPRGNSSACTHVGNSVLPKCHHPTVQAALRLLGQPAVAISEEERMPPPQPSN